MVALGSKFADGRLWRPGGAAWPAPYAAPGSHIPFFFLQVVSTVFLGGTAALTPLDARGQALVLPGAQPPTPAGVKQEILREARPPAAARPQAARPATAPSARAAVAHTVIGAPLFQGGNSGRLVIERVDDTSFAARLRVEGTQISDPGHACAVELGMSEPVALTDLGAPLGMPRYQLAAPICPMAFDVLEGAVLVANHEASCTFSAADCQGRIGGLWGPQAQALIAQAKDIERRRSREERNLRDKFRSLLKRLSGNELREAAAEQAGFSSEREMLCRDYAGEVSHGFCAERVTAARVVAVDARLAVTPEKKKAARP